MFKQRVWRHACVPSVGFAAIAVGTLVLCSAPTLGDQPFFQGLGDLPGGTSWSEAWGVSGNGSVVVGQSESLLGHQAFRWENGEMTGLDDLPGGDFACEAYSASDDGSVVVGWSNSGSASEAVRWINGVPEGLGFLPGLPRSMARGVSAGGSTVVGFGKDQGSSTHTPWRWSDDEMTELPLGPYTAGIGTAVSTSGSVVVGYGTYGGVTPCQAIRWEDGEPVLLPDLPGGELGSYALDMTPDGSVVVGGGYAETGWQAVRWDNGVISGLGHLPDYLPGLGGSSFYRAWGVSADGSVIVGCDTLPSGPEASIWDSVNGMRSLHDVLVNDYGLELTGWTLSQAIDVSADGRTIVGFGTNPYGYTEAWMAYIGGPATITVCPGDSGDYATIQDGIDAASNGDEVVVCDGTYTGPLNKNLDFGGKAITVRSANGPQNCIIDCEDSGRGFHFQSGEDSSSVVDGFTITNGHATGTWPDGAGGAIFCDYSSPTLANCVFSGNHADHVGGGLELRGSSSTVVGCTFRENVAEVGSDGGGDGGGIRIHLGGNPTVTNCIFIDNIAEPGGDGGGIFNGASTTTVINSVFSGNTARTGGAILCQGGTMTITTCTFSGNSASNVAGAVYCSTDVVTIANSVLWHNSPNEITGSVVATYSDVEGSWPGEGNIDEEPLFVDPENCDLRLQPGSPCIDAGDTTAVPCGLFVDLEGLGRVLDHRSVPDTGVPAALVPVTVDMGAYEFHLRGDINGDGAVNGLDVQPFVEAILTP